MSSVNPDTVSVIYYYSAMPPHSEMRIGDAIYSVGISTDGGKVTKSYLEAVTKAKKGGAPFVEFHVNITPANACALKKIVAPLKVDSETTSCMGFVAETLQEHNNLTLPYPASRLPFSSAVFLSGKYLLGKIPSADVQISQIKHVGTFKPTPKRLLGISLTAAAESTTVIPASILTSWWKGTVQTVSSTAQAASNAACSVLRIAIGH